MTSFSLELSTGFFQKLEKSSNKTNLTKPFLQILQIQPMQNFPSSRFKLVLSDGKNYMQTVLTPRLNSLVTSKKIQNNSLVKLLEYNVLNIKDKT